MRRIPCTALITAMALTGQIATAEGLSYPLVDTMQDRCFDLDGGVIDCPAEGEALHGQDAQYTRTPAAYTVNDDGTVTDTVTGLLWQRTPPDDRLQYAEAIWTCLGKVPGS